MKLINVESEYYLIDADAEVKKNDFCLWRIQHEWKTAVSEFDSPMSHYKVIASTKEIYIKSEPAGENVWVNKLPKIDSIYFFGTIGGKIGVVFPDEHDSVMGYCDTHQEAFDKLTDFFKDKKPFSLDEANMIFREGYNLCLSKHFKHLEGKIHPDEAPFENHEAMDFDEVVTEIRKDIDEYDVTIKLTEGFVTITRIKL